jgi:FkbM family methyltransferase
LKLDYIKHLAVGTPLYRPMNACRDLLGYFHRRRHPELAEIFAESDRIDRFMRAVIRSDSNCVDIGCHIGSILARMVQLAPAGHHIAFEPTTDKQRWLTRKFPNVIVHGVALGESNETRKFYERRKHSGYNTLAPGVADDPEFICTEVICRCLDDVLPADYHVDFIKIDVEGAELGVFRGAARTLARCRPAIVFECTTSGLAQYGVQPSSVYHTVTRDLGYHIFFLGDWLKGGPRVSESDFQESMAYPFKAFNYIAMPQPIAAPIAV